MRPKKVILLVDADQKELSLRSFALSLREFAVLATNTAQGALETIAALGVWEAWRTTGVAVMVVEDSSPLLDAVQLVRDVRRLNPEVLTMMTSRRRAAEPQGEAHLFLTEPNTAELVMRLRILTQRRRGPKKTPAESGVVKLAPRGDGLPGIALAAVGAEPQVAIGPAALRGVDKPFAGGAGLAQLLDRDVVTALAGHGERVSPESVDAHAMREARTA